ncbi:hypothetical protein JTE90_000529 [Oedothorax gibbosus]|uniref:Uncharacterized protein n=1 Tax=Oedothorax gibbosus TaxID=931172 RepID=A0AAV6VXA3_9ARAC|nr:hypothetical protein JTE90_000529 [Oedothorax gibbosus]
MRFTIPQCDNEGTCCRLNKDDKGKFKTGHHIETGNKEIKTFTSLTSPCQVQQKQGQTVEGTLSPSLHSNNIFTVRKRKLILELFIMGRKKMWHNEF